MRAFIHAAAFTSVSTLVTLLVGIGRTKVVALTLGVQGVGFISQVQTSLGFAAELVSFGFANAVVRGTAAAQADGDRERASTLLTTSYAVGLGFAAIIALALFLAPRPLIDSMFGAGAPTFTIAALAIAIPFTAIGSVERAVTQGLKSVRLLTVANMVAAIIGLAVLSPAVLLFGLNGALLHIASFSAISYALYMWARRRAGQGSDFEVVPHGRPRFGAARTLLGYGSANAVAGIARTANLLFVRTFIIATLGVEQNGIYQAIWAIPSQALSLILNTLSYYAFPLVSGMRERADSTAAVNASVRFTLLAATPLVVMLIVCSHPLVLALYSADFSPAAGLLPIQLLGDFSKVVAWALGISLLGRGHLAAFTGLDLTWNVVYAGGVLLLGPRLGLWGVVISYAAAYLLHATATYGFQHGLEGFRLTSANVRLLVCSCLLLAGTAALVVRADVWIQIVFVALGLTVWVMFGTESHERQAALRGAQSWMRIRLPARSQEVTIEP